MLADVAVLGLTLAAAHLAQRPAAGQATFGYGRVEILVALVNGLSLVAVSLYIALELLDRLQTPEAVVGLPMLTGATLGLAVNSFNVCLLYRSSRENLNYRSAFLHVAADAASSGGLVIASLAIHFWQWMWVDAIVSLSIAGMTAIAAIPLIKQSLEVFLEFAPRSLNPDTVKAAIAHHPQVEQVDTFHVWNITSNQVMLVAHLQVSATLSAIQRDQLVQHLQARLKRDFGIQHTTLQLVDRSIRMPEFHPLLHRSLTDYVFKKT
jgi:cobalt-zinc-cadmium efflux system protein